ncbi:MAG TPA: hypothetical protein DDZ51_14090 [Planctomycetaceae bacterium]|nr:hypothetical protein [Planctomycetaceae bacterium]
MLRLYLTVVACFMALSSIEMAFCEVVGLHRHTICGRQSKLAATDQAGRADRAAFPIGATDEY